MYGYVDDKKGPSYNFGLNASAAKLVKFAHTMNGGKDGAELEALDIVFSIGGQEKSYRKFPITKAFYQEEEGGPQLETTDPNHEAFKKAGAELGGVLTHIIGCFVDKSEIKTALEANPPTSFAGYCQVLGGLLPKNHSEISLDIFMNWQWQIGGTNTQTYLEFPKNMKQGAWLCPAVAPIGAWKEVRNSDAGDRDAGIYYTDDANNRHPFSKTGWFLNSNFANQQKEEDESNGAFSATPQPQSPGTPAGNTAANW